ncbi:unnamed protein product [Allacma fusca]|uniref:Uncharacterized protein n=1 Tax=Allacma fusca TaxID=39272 RepID=A0A8J2PN31_9HEXA|nr:unnamed protein product [Allacma fusca]
MGDFKKMSLSSRLTGIASRRKPVVDYASDSEAMSYTPSMRSAGLSLPASTRRSLGLTNGRSNSLPRDLIRGRGGRKQNVRFDKRGIPDLTSSLAGRRALLMSSGIHSEDESDGAASAPEMPTPRRDRGKSVQTILYTQHLHNHSRPCPKCLVQTT